MEEQQADRHPLVQLLDDHKVSLPAGLLDLLDDDDLDVVLKDISSTALRPVDDGRDEDEVPSEEPGPALDGALLLADPDAALTGYKKSGGEDDDLVAGYLASESFLHVMRAGGQPAMLRAVLKALVGPLARQMCIEAGVEGVSATLLAEQVAEARADEAFARALAGKALDDLEVTKAERLVRMADKHSRRMMRALEQLHRLRRPNVNVKIARASNVNMGQQQIINRPDDKAGPATPTGDGLVGRSR